jgi:putative ABC transport system ATP-binding protein
MPQLSQVWPILKPDKRFFGLATVYGIGIGVLTLSVPIAVQALLNTVVNTALTPFIALLAVLLFAVLLVAATLMACRDYAMELFQRRFLARLSSEAALRLTHADQPHMEGINRAELVNRFFEIMHVQKNVPALMTEGFFIALQTIVGLVVVSFYHPFLFLYNLLFVGILFLIWQMWSKKAIRRAIALSDNKYALVQWLEEIARVSQTFKSGNAITHAMEQTDNQTAAYLRCKKAYFKATFSQNIAFLTLYCVANAGLLGLGGILVARNQLSLGQLIGAELIMSAVFYSVSKLGYYARIYYDLYANLDKLNYFFRLPLEKHHGRQILAKQTAAQISFADVVLPYRGHRFHFNATLYQGSNVLAKSSDAATSKLFVDLLKGYRLPEQGHVTINGNDLSDYDLHDLRNHILSVDSVSIVEGSIRRFFDLYKADLSQAEIMSALELVELDKVVQALPKRLETHVVPSGYPLLQDEVIRLKLAAVLAAKPLALIITEVFDAVPFAQRKRIMQSLCAIENMTLICFTNRKEWSFFDSYLILDKGMTHNFASALQLIQHEDAQTMEQ